MAESLVEHVQSLPPELYNEVYELTFTADLKRRYIRRDGKLPSCLQVDHRTRELFAKAYYGQGSIFSIDYHDMKAWVFSLDPEHISALQEIRITGEDLDFHHKDWYTTTRKAVNFIGTFVRTNDLGINSHDNEEKRGSYFTWNFDFLGGRKDPRIGIGELGVLFARERSYTYLDSLMSRPRKFCKLRLRR